MSWKVLKSNFGWGEIVCTHLDHPFGSHSLLYSWYWVYFPGANRPERGVDHPSPFSVEVKERVELYLYFPCGTTWPDMG